MWKLLEQINTPVGLFASVLGIATTVFSIMSWSKARAIRRTQQQEEHRRSEPIRLILVRESDREEHILSYQPRRDQATRNEIMGILGMYYGSSRFDSAPSMQVLIDGGFSRMVAGITDELRVPVTDADYTRFVDRDRELTQGKAIVVQQSASSSMDLHSGAAKNSGG
jgi:hypothetical protein